MKKNILFGLICLLFAIAPSKSQIQCDFSDDLYSDPNTWTQVGTDVVVQNGRIEFLNGAIDGEQRRVYRELGFTLESDDCWEATFVFRPEMRGELNGLPMTGHLLFSLSETTQDPRYACPDIPCTGNPMNDQDAINVGYYTTNPPDGDVYFIIQCSNTGATLTSDRLVYDELNQDIYVKLTRVCGLLELNIYSDEDFTQPLGNGPVNVLFENVKPLTYIQHAANAGGRPERQLTATVDDVCLGYYTCAIDSTFVNASLCPGDTLFFGGQVITEAGDYVDVYSAVCGDSIVTVSVSVNVPTTGNFNGAICADETITIHGEVFDQNNTTGTITLEDANVFGCDSIVNVEITILTGPDCDSTTVPTLSEWGMITLLLLFSIVAIAQLREESDTISEAA